VEAGFNLQKGWLYPTGPLKIVEYCKITRHRTGRWAGRQGGVAHSHQALLLHGTIIHEISQIHHTILFCKNLPTGDKCLSQGWGQQLELHFEIFKNIYTSQNSRYWSALENNAESTVD
jgi:hypothetical protein